MHVAKITHDATDGLLQFQLHRLVTVHADSRRGHRNDEHNLAVPLRIIFQKHFIAAQPVNEALRVIQPVHGKNHLLPDTLLTQFRHVQFGFL